MAPKTPLHAADLHGFSRLAVDATLGLTDLVEAVHHTIVRPPAVFGRSANGRTGGITGFVYGSVRGITRLVGAGLDGLLGQLGRGLAEPQHTAERDSVIAALNGVLGDYLAATGSPLALPMRLRHVGPPLDLDPRPLAQAVPRPRGSVVLLIHGLCLHDRHWRRNGHDHGALLAEELDATPLYLHYNTGLHISDNGRSLAGLLQKLVHAWPVPLERMVIVGHSMGGLVTRSACYYGAQAGHTWPERLHTLIFLGSPHHGSPLERVGNWVHGALDANPYSAAFTRLSALRSAGITDLRYGSLLDEDWSAGDRFARTGDRPCPVPLPAGVRCCAVGASAGADADDPRGRLLGDGLVPVASALGQHPQPERDLGFPEHQRRVVYAANHFDLLDRPEVYAQMREWLAPLAGGATC